MNFILPSYKLQFRVVDESGSAFFLLFDGSAYQVIGKTASELRAQVIKDGDTDSFPEDLDIVVGKQFAFKIEVKAKRFRDRSQSYKVVRISNDKDVIANLIGNTQYFEDSTANVVNLESQYEKTPTSGKGKEIIDVTNGKELNFGDDEMSRNNKLSKKIKIEKTD